MLVLTRKKNETLLIGDGIEITIVDIQSGSVKIGIKAPNNIRIIRKEIIEQVTEINKNSTFNVEKINLSELARKISK